MVTAPRHGGAAKLGRGEATRGALVRAAVLALSEVGFAGASAREIARRAECNQALVFYHFGSVTDLLLAALDHVSATRMAAYAELIDGAVSLATLVDAAETIFLEDLDSGHVAVLVEMINGARTTPGLGEQVAARLRPWVGVAESAVATAMSYSPLPLPMPAADLAHAVVAGFLGVELLADLDGGRESTLALFARARAVAALVDALGAPSRPTGTGVSGP